MSLDLAPPSPECAPRIVAWSDHQLLGYFNGISHPLSALCVRDIVLAKNTQPYFGYWANNDLRRLLPERFDFLASMVQRSGCLRLLDLSDSSIGLLPRHRFLQLIKAVAESPNLATVVLNNNNLDQMAPDALVEALALLGASRKLERVVLYDNYLRLADIGKLAALYPRIAFTGIVQ